MAADHIKLNVSGNHMPHCEREAVANPEWGIITSRCLKVARRSKQQANIGRGKIPKKRLSARILKRWASQSDVSVKLGEVVKAHFPVRHGRSAMLERAVVMQPPIEGYVRLHFAKRFWHNLREVLVPVEWALPMKSISTYEAMKGNSKRLRRKEIQRQRRQIRCL
jgi:hypothetical protein